MRISQFLVCFFLPFSFGSAPVQTDWWARLHTLETQAETCDIHHASSVSKDLSKLYQEILSQKETIQIQKDQIEDQLQEQKNDLLQQKKKIQRQKDQIAIELLKNQRTYPVFSNDLQNPLQSLVTQCGQYQSLQEQVQKLEKQWESFQTTSQDMDKIQKRVESAQKDLWLRFGKGQTPEFKNGQTFDSHQIIQGTQDLPVFGGVHANDWQVPYTCLSPQASIAQTSPFFQNMISGSTISAGTWQYPQGGLHLGMDLASNLYSEVSAPANGIILYADTPCDSVGGYLGNWEGWPYGGGNTICMIVSVQEQLYAISLAHLSNEFYVQAGQQVHQGDVLALSGNSGNSSGPHTHVEVFEIHVSLEEAVTYFMDQADFAFGCGWDAPATSSAIATRLRPETVL